MDFTRFSLLNGDVQLLGRRRLGAPVHLVFAHGWISSRRMWDEVCAGVAGDYTVTAFDFRGCGESDRPREGHDLSGYTSDLRAVIAACDGPVVLVAHSMGARISQFVACDPPSNLRGLFLVAPGAAAGTPIVARHRELTARAYGSRRRLSAFQRGAMVREVSEAVRERLLEDALIAQYEHWFGWYDSGRVLDFSERLSAITLPTAVVAGEGDALISVGRIRREVIERINGATLEIIPNAGHNLAVEAPDEVLAALHAFIRGTENLF